MTGCLRWLLFRFQAVDGESTESSVPRDESESVEMISTDRGSTGRLPPEPTLSTRLRSSMPRSKKKLECLQWFYLDLDANDAYYYVCHIYASTFAKAEFTKGSKRQGNI